MRERLGLDRREFANRYKLSVRTLERWENGEMPLEGTARVLLYLIDREPDMIAHILRGLSDSPEMPQEQHEPRTLRGRGR